MTIFAPVGIFLSVTQNHCITFQGLSPHNITREPLCTKRKSEHGCGWKGTAPVRTFDTTVQYGDQLLHVSLVKDAPNRGYGNRYQYRWGGCTLFQGIHQG